MRFSERVFSADLHPRALLGTVPRASASVSVSPALNAWREGNIHANLSILRRSIPGPLDSGRGERESEPPETRRAVDEREREDSRALLYFTAF